jgi:prepilin-type N-terminal cleavage/methylation domain-containing protein
MKWMKSETGVTLIEVLAAVVILSIILGSIMNFFPQMGFMNNTNGDKSQAINSAKNVLNKWQIDGKVQNYLASNGSSEVPDIGTKLANVTFSNQADFNGTFYHFVSTEGNFNYDIFIKTDSDPDIYTTSSSSPIGPSNKAYLTKVKVSNTKTNITTDTFGYIIF